MLANWLKTKVGRKSYSGRRLGNSLPAFRPQLEVLECRLAPATLTVTSTADSGAGSLRTALAAANNGDTIGFALPSGSTIQLTSATLTVNKNITIQGPGAAALTVNGNGSFTDFTVTAAANATINGLTISGGTAADGGGIQNLGTLLLTADVISGNTGTSHGGGIFNGGNLDVESTTITNNTVTTGTGGGGDGEGGGIANGGGILVVNQCLITNNTAAGGGGGIYNAFAEDISGTVASGGAIATVMNSTIANNTLVGNGQNEGGAGLLNEDNSSLTVTNCTITGNNAGPLTGGGIAQTVVATDTLIVTNCTIVGNIASTGGGIYHDGSGTITLINSIIAANTGSNADIDGTVTAGNNNLIGTGAGMKGLTNGIAGNIIGPVNGVAINPLVAPLANYGGPLPTMALLPGSPAINAGANNGTTADERGVARPQQSAPDIGAFESHGFVMTIVSGNGSRAGRNQPFPPLVVLVVANDPLEPVVGGQVTFTGPTSGPGVTFDNLQTTFAATIAANGTATTTPVANNIPGKVTVIASATGANSLTFNLLIVLPYIAVGAGEGGTPEVRVFDGQTGAIVADFNAFSAGFRGGVRVAVGDINGDAFPDIIVGAGAGGGPQVTVFDGKALSQGNIVILRSFYALSPSFTGGVYVAAGDTNGDGLADIIVGAGEGGGPQVTVYSGQDNSILTSFYAFNPSFTGGVRVAAGDTNGDGLADIVTGAGPGGAPQVTIYNGKTQAVLKSYFAFPVTFGGGVYVAAGDLNGDGLADVIVGAGQGGLPQVNTFDGSTAALLQSFYAYPPQVPKVDAPQQVTGVRVGFATLDRGVANSVMTGRGFGAPPELKVIQPSTLKVIDDFFALNPLFMGGIFVAG